MDQPVSGFSAPTSIAWWRMKQILLNPFDMGKWFILGFSAWLASLLESGGSSGGSGSSPTDFSEGTEEIEEGVETAFDWVKENLEVIIGVGAIVIVVLVVFGVLFAWLSSRGKFMFLDNVVRNRALVSEPWREFKREGNSLFLWLLAFSVITFVIFGGVIGGFGWMIYAELSANEMVWAGEAIGLVIGLVGVVLILALVSSYILMLLEDFVIPLMYHRRVKVLESWREVLALNSQFTGKLVLFFFWRILLQFAWGFAIMAVVLVTCCIAGIIFAIPYIGTVATLPMYVFFRALGPTFMQQFGPEFDIWAGKELDVTGTLRLGEGD